MQPVEVDFDADISAEEMQMMQAMGIPFLFDTTQVWTPFVLHCKRCFSFLGLQALMMQPTIVRLPKSVAVPLLPSYL